MIEIGKDVGISDWMSLAIYFNDVAFVVLMGPNGLLQPNIPSTAPPGRRGVNAKLLQLNAWERLPQHCLLVCTELMMRWAWVPESRLWDIYGQLVRDYSARRHGSEIVGDNSKEIEEFNYFIKLCLMNAGMHLVDIADRLGASQLVIHAAFDIIRSAFLLRPLLFRNRHVYQIVYCSLAAAAHIFAPNKPGIDFGRINQAVSVSEAKIFSKYIIQSTCLSDADGGVLFSDGSGALVMPNESGQPQPEFQLSGDVQSFYEKIFVSELRQVLFNLKKTTQRRSIDHPKGDYGPFVDGLESPNPRNISLSPFAFVAISSSMALAMQQTTGGHGLQYKSVPYEMFKKSAPLVSPMGVLPCLLPPIVPSQIPQNQSEVYYKWIPDSVIRATKDGTYSIIQDE
jgi:hypothetical protein